MSQSPMAKAARPHFHDPTLQQALEQVAPKIESFTSTLDRLSSDIKNLEAFLERSAVRVPVRVKMGDFRGPAGEYIAWDLGEPDRFRIVYFQLVHDGYESLEERERTVLIEAPVPTRVRAREALSDLLRAVGKMADLGYKDGTDSSDEGPPSDDDMPF